MLAREYDLVAFVRRVTAICRGKAYFHHAILARRVRPHGLHGQENAHGALAPELTSIE